MFHNLHIEYDVTNLPKRRLVLILSLFQLISSNPSCWIYPIKIILNKYLFVQNINLDSIVEFILPTDTLYFKKFKVPLVLILSMLKASFLQSTRWISPRNPYDEKYPIVKSYKFTLFWVLLLSLDTDNPKMPRQETGFWFISIIRIVMLTTCWLVVLQTRSLLAFLDSENGQFKKIFRSSRGYLNTSTCYIFLRRFIFGKSFVDSVMLMEHFWMMLLYSVHLRATEGCMSGESKILSCTWLFLSSKTPFLFNKMSKPSHYNNIEKPFASGN